MIGASGNDDHLGDGEDLGDLGLFDQIGDIPHPVDWSVLSAAERRDELVRLWPWVVELAGVAGRAGTGTSC